MNANKKTRMSDLIHSRLRVTSVDGRSYTGELLAFDGHLNLVLANAEEGRLTKKTVQELKKGTSSQATEQKRLLGLVVLRGEQVVGFSVELGPTSTVAERMEKGRGTTRPVRPVKVPTKGFRRQ